MQKIVRLFGFLLIGYCFFAFIGVVPELTSFLPVSWFSEISSKNEYVKIVDSNEPLRFRYLVVSIGIVLVTISYVFKPKKRNLK